MDYVPGTNYKIIQSEDHFKFGVDSVLLSRFAKMEENKVLADLGTGVGILALSCHYLYRPEKIYAFEIQEDLVAMAKESVKINGLENEILVIRQDIKESQRLDLDYIITNPPYYEKGRSRENHNKSKLIAFHEIHMNLDDVFSFAKTNLKDRGKLFMVNKGARLADVIEKARNYKMEPVRLRFVHSFKDRRSHLLLGEFVKNGGKNLHIERPLIIYNDDGSYTDELEEIYYG